MESEDLEIVLREKVKPLVDKATEENLGVSIDRLSEDITSKLTAPTLIELEVDTALPYKQAKRKFKKAFLTKLLLLNLGNISEVARITGSNRRSIHRLIKLLGINIKKIKRELIRPYDMQLSAINIIIGNVLDDYRTILHPDKLRAMYGKVSGISEDILRELPSPRMTFSEAQVEFEKRYFSRVLKENSHNIMKTAKKIGLRHETLQRKLRALKMI